jgi:hypothetical protein
VPILQRKTTAFATPNNYDYFFLLFILQNQIIVVSSLNNK